MFSSRAPLRWAVMGGAGVVAGLVTRPAFSSRGEGLPLTIESLTARVAALEALSPLHTSAAAAVARHDPVRAEALPPPAVPPPAPAGYRLIDGKAIAATIRKEV